MSLEKEDLRFNQSSLEILPSKTAEREATRIPLNEGMEFSRVRMLVVLDCYLDGSGSTETQVKGRLGQGRKMFCKLRPLLCCPRIPEEERIETFYTTVASSVLWGAGCWIPSTKLNSLFPSRKPGGSAACWEVVKPKTFRGWTGFVRQNALRRR